MSWAARRETTRVEDLSYCLLGIFQVSMPMIYGEDTNAFLRLQEEIIKRSNDLTILAWNRGPDEPPYGGVLALSPAGFANSNNIVPISRARSDPVFAITNRGLRFDNFKMLCKKLITYNLHPETRTFYPSDAVSTFFIPLGFLTTETSFIALLLRKVGPNLFIRYSDLVPRAQTRLAANQLAFTCMQILGTFVIRKPSDNAKP